MKKKEGFLTAVKNPSFQSSRMSVDLEERPINHIGTTQILKGSIH